MKITKKITEKRVYTLELSEEELISLGMFFGLVGGNYDTHLRRVGEAIFNEAQELCENEYGFKWDDLVKFSEQLCDDSSLQGCIKDESFLPLIHESLKPFPVPVEPDDDEDEEE